MKKDEDIIQLYAALAAERDEYIPHWRDISKYVGIRVDTDFAYNKNRGNNSKSLDEFVDDPTSAIAVQQAGDYLVGLMWGTGDNVISLVPSRYVLEYDTLEALQDYYGFITDQTLYHMNHADAGLHTCLMPYAYDQFSFGTSGIGGFPNKSFMAKQAENALSFRQYGVDNLVAGEGKSGRVEYVFVLHRWKVGRWVQEFCTVDGEVAQKSIEALPKKVRKCWEQGKINEEFGLIQGIVPHDEYNPRRKGKLGAKYRGVWFLEGDKEIFKEEWFSHRPINIARQIKVRGETYGRASGTMLLSTIRSVNYMLALTIEIMEKMGNPSLGIFSNAIFGDSVLDSSPNGMTVFNAAMAGNGQAPVFPLYDVGDPSGIVQFLIPYLNDKITTAFKVDALLDFNSAKDMTATESLQRYAIRGKSLSSMLQQQKSELLEPMVKRCVSILMDMNELGVDATVYEDVAARLRRVQRPERIIPQAVLDVMADGKPWFEVRFNNELEKLTRTDKIQNLVQLIQTVGAIAMLFPQIVEAVDWHKILMEINDNLEANSQIVMGADEFKEKLAAMAQQQAAMMQLQAAQMGAVAQKDSAQAGKLNREERQ